MPEALLLGELESADWVVESLEKVEDALRNVAQVIGQTAEKMKGTALAFENAWRKIVTNVARGQTTEMQAARPGLLSDFATWLDLLKRTHALLTGLHKRGRTDLDPDFLLAEIAAMEHLQAHVFDCWQSADDLERLVVEHYPLSQSRLKQIAATHTPPTEWYQGEEERLFQE
jgi:hypothetical protein